MQLATIDTRNGRRLVAADGAEAVDLFEADPRPAFRTLADLIRRGADGLDAARAALAGAPAETRMPLADLAFAPPLMPSTVLCAGSNYHAHNAEKANAPTSGKEPEFFLKTADCVIGPGEDIVCDDRLTSKLDCETELAIVIGRQGRHISVEDALDHVFGYTVANDVTARDRQVRRTPEGVVYYELGRGKAFDSSLPLGPVVTTSDEIRDPQNLSLSTHINGELRQSASTSDMIWSCAELIHFFSINFTLKPGMVILTGTPAGTAWSVDTELGGTWHPAPGLVAATRYCLPGDVIESTVSGIGTLTNTVVTA